MTDIKSLLDKHAKNKIKEAPFPKWIDPMLATLTHNYFDDEDWIFERKLDGERCIVYCNKNKSITLMSRNKKELNHRYPEIVKALASLPISSYILDGEIVAFDGDVTSFSKLQGRMHLSEDADVKDSDIDVYYYAFDILYIDKYDVRDMSLKSRKRLLKDSFDFKSPLYYVSHIKEEGKSALKKACDKGREGLIAKDYTSNYGSSRSKKWLKFKCENRQEFVIIGYTEPEGERIGFGALLIGYYEDDTLQYAGKVGTGYTDDMLETLANKFKEVEVKESPLSHTEAIKEKNVHWLKPVMVGEVSFTEWTDDNKLRHPSFQGIRKDKDPKDVVKEE